MDLLTVLDMVAGALPDRVLIGSADGGLSGAELARRAAAGGALVAAHQPEVLIYAGMNAPSFPIALFSAAQAGVPLLPVNYRLSTEQLAEVLSRQERAVVISDNEDQIAMLAPGLTVISTSEFMARTAAETVVPDFVAADPESIALLLMTSGTTAAPKSAVLRHHHLTSYLFGSVEFASAAEDEAALVTVPPYHIAAVANLLSNLFAGRRIVYLDRFTAAEWLELARTERVTNAMLVPTMLTRIVRELTERDETGPPSLRTLSYGGAKVTSNIVAEALQCFPGTGFVNAYGLTETSSTIAVLGPDDHRLAFGSADPAVHARLRSVGQSLPDVSIEIHDALGQSCLPRAVGEVMVRGPQVAGEYLEGGSRLDAAGWFATRDRGYLDEEGYLFIEGRADDTIIRGGENVAPAEIEEVLAAHPDVAECAIVGIPDAEWGQRIAAFVVLRENRTVEAAALQQFVRHRLRGAKTPDVVTFMNELPHTPTGKLLRRQLVADYAPTMG